MHMGQLSTLYMVITCNDLQNDLAALQSKRNLTTSIWPLSAAMSKGHFPATNIRYPPIIKHGSGKSPNWMEVLIGKSPINSTFSIAMFEYRRVTQISERRRIFSGQACAQKKVYHTSIVKDCKAFRIPSQQRIYTYIIMYIYI